MAKAQFQATEALRVRVNPFINSVTGSYIIGTDTCTLNWEKPDTSSGNVPMVWDATIQMWTYDFAVPSYMQGEWRFRAVSSDPNALPQWKTYVWGDYVDDITAAKTQATNAAVAATSADTKIGAPVAGTVSLDVAAVQTKLGVPAAGTVSLDVAGITAIVTVLEKIALNRWKVDVGTKTFIIYDNDKVTPLYTFNVKDDVGALNAYKIFERTPP